MPVRIAILGGPRCGKTTLIQQLYVDLKIRDINVGVATEYSTDYLREIREWLNLFQNNMEYI